MFASATDLAASIAAREVSAVEVVSAHLDRVSADVNAFTFLDAEGALAAASDPLPGPLSGVPFTVKDTVSVADWPLVMGDPARVDAVAEADATVVSRLRAAGAILVGKTNCPPYGGGIETDNPVTGARTTRTTSRGRRAGRPEVRRRRSRPERRRSGSALTPAPRCGCRRTSAGSLRSSRPRAASR